MKQISVTELKSSHKRVIAKFGNSKELVLTRYGKPLARMVLIDDMELPKIEAQELSVNVIK